MNPFTCSQTHIHTYTHMLTHKFTHAYKDTNAHTTHLRNNVIIIRKMCPTLRANVNTRTRQIHLKDFPHFSFSLSVSLSPFPFFLSLFSFYLSFNKTIYGSLQHYNRICMCEDVDVCLCEDVCVNMSVRAHRNTKPTHIQTFPPLREMPMKKSPKNKTPYYRLVNEEIGLGDLMFAEQWSTVCVCGLFFL